jgi:hypothetical protein
LIQVVQEYSDEIGEDPRSWKISRRRMNPVVAATHEPTRSLGRGFYQISGSFSAVTSWQPGSWFFVIDS